MSSGYSTRRGTARRTIAVSNADLCTLPYRERSDDGRELVCGTEPWPDRVLCPDCQRADVRWAEAGFVPGHRICPCCGSHWELTTRDARDGEPADRNGNVWILRRARFYR
jgi:hypothetical protein